MLQGAKDAQLGRTDGHINVRTSSVGGTAERTNASVEVALGLLQAQKV